MTPTTPPGRFCREIHVTVTPRRAVGELIDDFHHFRATIDHDGKRVTSVVGEALRIPWQTCGGAVNPVRGLAGAAAHVDLAQAVSVHGVACTPVVSSHDVLALVLPPHRHARRDGRVHAAVVALDRDRVAAGLVVRLLDEVAGVRHLGRSREKSWVVNVRVR